MNRKESPFLENQRHLRNVRLKLFLESTTEVAEDLEVQESEDDLLGETVILSTSPKKLLSPSSVQEKRIRRLNKFKTPSPQVGRSNRLLAPTQQSNNGDIQSVSTLKRKTLNEESTSRKRAKCVLETWMKPYQHCIERCMDLLDVRHELSNKTLRQMERTSGDKTSVPSHVIQAALAKYNMYMSRKFSGIGLNKQLRQFLHTQDADRVEKCTDSKAFWEECKRNVNFSPPKDCPVKLRADREQYEQYTAVVERIVNIQKKNTNLFDAIIALGKFRMISANLTKLSKKKSSWSQLQKTKARKEEARHGMMEIMKAVHDNILPDSSS